MPTKAYLIQRKLNIGDVALFSSPRKLPIGFSARWETVFVNYPGLRAQGS